LILLDPDRLASAPALQTLAEFAATGEGEQLEAYAEAYPAETGGAWRSALPARRVVEPQLEALRCRISLPRNP
jgi:hypothetical protein